MRKIFSIVVLAALVSMLVTGVTVSATQAPYHSVLKRVVIAANAVDTLASACSTTVYVPRANGSLDEMTAWLSQIRVEAKSPFRWKSSLYGSGTSTGHTFINWADADTNTIQGIHVPSATAVSSSIKFPVILTLAGITDSLRVTGTAADTINVWYDYDIPDDYK